MNNIVIKCSLKMGLVHDLVIVLGMITCGSSSGNRLSLLIGINLFKLIIKLNEYHVVAIYDLNTINHLYNYLFAIWDR